MKQSLAILFILIATSSIALADIPANVQVGPPLAFNSFTANANPISQGDVQILTAWVYNGFSPYSYKYDVYAPNGLLVSTTTYSNVNPMSNSFSYTQQSAWGAGIFTATVNVIDDATLPEKVGGSLVYNVVSSQILVLEWQLNPLLFNGQNQILNATLPLDVNSPFTYNWVVYAPNGFLVYNSLNSGKLLANNQTIFQVANGWAVGNYVETVYVTDNSGFAGSNTLILMVSAQSGGNSIFNHSFLAFEIITFAATFSMLFFITFPKDEKKREFSYRPLFLLSFAEAAWLVSPLIITSNGFPISVFNNYFVFWIFIISLHGLLIVLYLMQMSRQAAMAGVDSLV